MDTEIEAKFLNVDHDHLRQKLQDTGAQLVAAERLMRRKVFDYPDGRLEHIGGWVRVRDEGDKITMSYKQLSDRTLHGTKEITLTVSDYQQACLFLESIGLNVTSYQETKRESWTLKGVEIELDTWPWIPSFVEFEAKDEILLKTVVAQLDLDWADAMHGSVETAYQAVYDVTEQEVDSWDTITFIPVPEWLEQRRIRK
jgi:adenylate cyclase, class 2